MKVTIDLDADHYRAVKAEATRTNRSVGDIVDEALETWLDASETDQDRTSADGGLDRIPS